MNDYFINGQATFAMNYFAFLPALANQGTNPNYYDKVGFFSNPKGPYGQQYASLGGQGTSINAYIDDARKAASLEFIQVVRQPERGPDEVGRVGRLYLQQEGPRFRCVPEGFALQRRLRRNHGHGERLVPEHFPEYGELLPPAQTALSNFVVGGQGTSQEALDAIAAEHDKRCSKSTATSSSRCPADQPGLGDRPGWSAPMNRSAVASATAEHHRPT